jgi:hypothetical protein
MEFVKVARSLWWKFPAKEIHCLEVAMKTKYSLKRFFVKWPVSLLLLISVNSLVAYGQEKDPLQQKLIAQFPLTQVDKNSGDIATAGAVVVLQRDGLILYSTASPLPPLNTYKSGKITQSFGRDFWASMAAPGTATTADYPHRSVATGEKLWVVALSVQKTDIVFRLYSDPYDGIRYYGELKFQFDKGQVPTPDQALGRIAEVLAVDQAVDGPAPPQFSGLYISLVGQAQLQFNPDGSFTQHGPAGLETSGTFVMTGDVLRLIFPGSGRFATFNIREDKLFNAGGTAVWARQQDAPAVVQMKLPATYLNAQNSSDQLQLNADNSFTLQDGGQSYHGTFAVNGSTLELNITELRSKSTGTMQGNSIADGYGRTWVLREQPVQSASGADILKNEDVMKMAKAGFDDDTIIAKIKNSKCQFDTSTDALIELKHGGVSAHVIEAMLAGGK